jgi:hypothetical protein
MTGTELRCPRWRICGAVEVNVRRKGAAAVAEGGAAVPRRKTVAAGMRPEKVAGGGRPVRRRMEPEVEDASGAEG